ncbi:hypothetical protein FA95DRAFT_1031979 [Auriscalpium vulgare]|uniref:Uncharacterized protein n=1 Tax=Auriscalpium vulgare TaxID=40419 RepID=A0ACB8RWG2_9AGAM|nr:hypothetical protein FA95DRAFT_1031979 [Auriscalpium vulgare]
MIRAQTLISCGDQIQGTMGRCDGNYAPCALTWLATVQGPTKGRVDGFLPSVNQPLSAPKPPTPKPPHTYPQTRLPSTTPDAPPHLTSRIQLSP